jgi:hypothetical protein
MSVNPYKPPGAKVSDLPPERLLRDRPRQVVQAVRLLWLSLVISLPLMYFEQQRAPDEAGAFMWIFGLVMLTLVAALYVFVWRGANWARIIFLVLWILTQVWVATTFAQMLQYSLVEIALHVVSLAIEALALYLLFTKPGSLWFRAAPQP